ncbi:MAG: hypothetical protein GX318_07050 [Clostridia bacterium]|nr:hypothetical protein [Clostridia bacterium]
MARNHIFPANNRHVHILANELFFLIKKFTIGVELFLGSMNCSCAGFFLLSISMVIPVIVLYYVIKVAVKNAIKELKNERIL